MQNIRPILFSRLGLSAGTLSFPLFTRSLRHNLCHHLTMVPDSQLSLETLHCVGMEPAGPANSGGVRQSKACFSRGFAADHLFVFLPLRLRAFHDPCSAGSGRRVMFLGPAGARVVCPSLTLLGDDGQRRADDRLAAMPCPTRTGAKERREISAPSSRTSLNGLPCPNKLARCR